MKTFTHQDLVQGNLPHIFTTEHSKELVDAPLWWQEKGLQQTASGYGYKLTTNWKISFQAQGEAKSKLYRVYCTQFSNAGSCWFTVRGTKIFIN